MRKEGGRAMDGRRLRCWLIEWGPGAQGQEEPGEPGGEPCGSQWETGCGGGQGAGRLDGRARTGGTHAGGGPPRGRQTAAVAHGIVWGCAGGEVLGERGGGEGWWGGRQPVALGASLRTV